MRVPAVRRQKIDQETDFGGQQLPRRNDDMDTEVGTAKLVQDFAGRATREIPS